MVAPRRSCSCRAAPDSSPLWAATTLRISRSPRRAQRPKRSSVSTNKEIAVVWEKTHLMGVYGLICRVLIVSGQRLGQIAHLSSAYIDRGKKLITWPPELMKGNREFVLPYGDLLNSLLPQGEGLVF